jgi:hypothetical protein
MNTPDKVAAQKNANPSTIDPLSFAVPSASAPEFLRLPKRGQRDPIFGLSRSYLNYLILPSKENNFRPAVRSSVLRRRGAHTGVRLIDIQSLREFVFANTERRGEQAQEI